MLHTLGYRIPSECVDTLFGHVTVYLLDDDFAQAWSRLPKQRNGKGKLNPPAYAQLATGLTAVHGQPVRLFRHWQLSHDDLDAGAQALMVTRGMIDPANLATAFRTWEKLIRNGADRNTLAPLLPPPEPQRSFTGYITASDANTADAPGWVFDCARWEIMHRLAARPLALGKRKILRLRQDTDGFLLAWDDLLANTWKEWTGFGMLRITSRIITFPGLPELAICFDAHLSRINNQWRGTKSTWIDRDDAELPILRLPVKNVPHDGDRWSTEPGNHAAEIAAACGLERLSLDQDLPELPGRIRPLIPAPRKHPIGKGPGARLMLRLADHIAKTIPELVPLTWNREPNARIREPLQQVLGTPPTKHLKSDTNDKRTKRADSKVGVLPDTIHAAVNAAGYQRLHVACLYATSNARQRMVDQLAQLAPSGIDGLPTQDGNPRAIHAGMTVSFHRLPTLLAHGTHDRTADLKALTSLTEDGVLLLAWAETEWDVQTDPPKDDAKNSVRRLLAKNGIATQFLATPPAGAPAPRRRRRTQAATAADHGAAAGLRDLILRTGGVLHPRVTRDILAGEAWADPGLMLVGIHARLQHSTNNDEPRLVLTTVAVHTTTDPDTLWRAEMFSESQASWVPYPAGIADFHAGPIGTVEHGRRGEKAAQTRQHMESVLAALGHGPTVVFLDAGETRTIWPGLQNREFRTKALPGLNRIAAGQDLAIIRCNGSREVPRPVDREGGSQPADPDTPAAPDRVLYRQANTDEPVWLFPKSSRIYRAKGGRTGALHTPWTLPEELHHLLADDWHSYTGTEIAVTRNGSWQSLDLALLTARLCDHTVSWDDRTLFPIPLHLAARADITHPEFRSDDEDDSE